MSSRLLLSTKFREQEEPSRPPSLLRNSLRNGLPHPSQPIQPVDRGLVEAAHPKFDLGQNSSTRPLETASTAAMSMLSCTDTTNIVGGPY